MWNSYKKFTVKHKNFSFHQGILNPQEFTFHTVDLSVKHSVLCFAQFIVLSSEVAQCTTAPSVSEITMDYIQESFES